MREIKFRGKRKDNGEWVEGHYAKIAVNFGQNDVIIEQTKGGSFVPQFIDIKTLGQFTGLLDKNGKEIYEGDVIQDNNYKDEMAVMKWDDKKAQLATDLPIGWFWSKMERIEVIGNIHDNPELMKLK